MKYIKGLLFLLVFVSSSSQAITMEEMPPAFGCDCGKNIPVCLCIPPNTGIPKALCIGG